MCNFTFVVEETNRRINLKFYAVSSILITDKLSNKINYCIVTILFNIPIQ
jgi:hypothetical protein